MHSIIVRMPCCEPTPTPPANSWRAALSPRGILGSDDFVRVACKLLEQFVGRFDGIDANPVLGRQIERRTHTIVLRFEFVNQLGLAFEGDHPEVVTTEEGEHVPTHIEHQHVAGIVECGEWHFFLHIGAQREAKVTIVLDVHRHGLSQRAIL